MLVTRNVVTKEEVIAAIRELAEKLERRPTMPELCGMLKTHHRAIRKLFGSWAKAVEAAGLIPAFRGTLSMQWVLEDWRTVARKLGRIPTIDEYEIEGRHSCKPLKDRFGTWKNVPAGLLEFGDRKQLWAGWEDVREMAQRYFEERRTSSEPPPPISGELQLDVDMMYGAPLTDSPMATAPTNELGVMVLFGGMARKLGFVVLKLQKGFPDCEALREVDTNRWQRVRIEFEFESRNFLVHGHDPEECDLIVCWEHNWEQCGKEVVELSRIARDRT